MSLRINTSVHRSELSRLSAMLGCTWAGRCRREECAGSRGGPPGSGREARRLDHGWRDAAFKPVDELEHGRSRLALRRLLVSVRPPRDRTGIAVPSQDHPLRSGSWAIATRDALLNRGERLALAKQSLQESRAHPTGSSFRGGHQRELSEITITWNGGLRESLASRSHVCGSVAPGAQ